MRLHHLVWGAVGGPVGAVGVLAAVLGLRGGVVLVALLGCLLGWSVSVAAHDWPWVDTRAGSIQLGLAHHALVGGISAVVGVGLFLLLGPPGAALWLVVLLTSPPVWQLAERLILRSGPDENSDDASAADLKHGEQTASLEGLPAPDLSCLSDDELRVGWRRSFMYVSTSPTPTFWSMTAQLRAAFLDEFERRDPTGFARWIDHGARAASDPGRYMSHGTEGLGPATPRAD